MRTLEAATPVCIAMVDFPSFCKFFTANVQLSCLLFSLSSSSFFRHNSFRPLIKIVRQLVQTMLQESDRTGPDRFVWTESSDEPGSLVWLNRRFLSFNLNFFFFFPNMSSLRTYFTLNCLWNYCTANHKFYFLKIDIFIQNSGSWSLIASLDHKHLGIHQFPSSKSLRSL